MEHRMAQYCDNDNIMIESPNTFRLVIKIDKNFKMQKSLNESRSYNAAFLFCN